MVQLVQWNNVTKRANGAMVQLGIGAMVQLVQLYNDATGAIIQMVQWS
jgi:hypothetical protein